MNEALRDHVTNVGFNLSLTKNQIAALVWLDVMSGAERSVGSRSASNWVTSIQGCMRRGLVTHHYDDVEWQRMQHDEFMALPIGHFFKITDAGKAVLFLLHEAGLYQEHYARLFPLQEAAAS